MDTRDIEEEWGLIPGLALGVRIPELWVRWLNDLLWWVAKDLAVG